MKKSIRRTIAGGAVLLSVAMATGGAAWAQTSEEHLTLIYRSSNGVEEPTRAAAGGPIAGSGVETQVVDRDSEDGESGRFTVRLQRGTVSGTFEEFGFLLNYDPRSCTASPTSTGTFTITSGTGAFTGATGVLVFRAHGTIVANRGPSGECFGPETGIEPRVVVVIIEAVGTVSVKGW